MGNVGLPELLIIITGVGLAGLALRRAGLAMSGPTLVLKKFEVRATGMPAVEIEGRPAGFVGWLLTTVGLDTLTTLTITDRRLTVRSASLSGESHFVVPIGKISSTECSYSQPIWLLIVGALVLLVSLLLAVNSQDVGTLVGGLLLAGACLVVYVLQRKIVLEVETDGGRRPMVAFKPSVIESVSINLKQTLHAVSQINRIIVAHDTGAGVTDAPDVEGDTADTTPRCPKCSAEILDRGSNFCGSCGSRLHG